MSQENVEVVRKLLESVNRRGLDAEAEQLYDPDVEFREDPKFPEADMFRGRDEVSRYFSEFWASFEQVRFESEDLRDAGDDRVVGVLREQARGQASGAQVERRSGWVISLRNGRVLKMEIYLDPTDALKAVGLEEQA